MTSFKLGTRGSKLALTQSGWVQGQVEAATGARVELEIIQTTGDRTQDRPLPEIGGKGLFTLELDRALLEGEIDFAVHSLKDLPTDQEAGLEVVCVPQREDPRDAVLGPGGEPVTLEGLPEGAILGTSSLRRQALARAFRSDLRIKDIRGNVDTRLRKLDEGQYDAVIMAAAGIRRMGLEDRIGEWLEGTAWLPAPAQGALGIVGRSGDGRVTEALSGLAHAPTWAAVRAERTFLATLEGGCQVPIGALGMPYQDGLRLWGLVASPDGRRVVRGDLTGQADDPEALGEALAELVRQRGATEILDELEAAASSDAGDS